MDATQELLRRFNQTIDQWIDALDGYTLPELQARPSPAEWSLGQVYVHLIQDTGFFTEQIRLAIAANGADSDKGMPEFSKTMFANNSFPDAKLGNPANNINLRQPESVDELKDGLRNIRNNISTICRENNFALASGKTGHPGLGYFTASQWLQFAEMHLRHHLGQKKRIDEALIGDKIAGE